MNRPPFSDLLPIQVAAIEALAYVRQRCGASDLREMLAPTGITLSQLAYQLSRLDMWGYVVRSDRQLFPGILESVYTLPGPAREGGP